MPFFLIYSSSSLLADKGLASLVQIAIMHASGEYKRVQMVMEFSCKWTDVLGCNLQLARNKTEETMKTITPWKNLQYNKLILTCWENSDDI